MWELRGGLVLSKRGRLGVLDMCGGNVLGVDGVECRVCLMRGGAVFGCGGELVLVVQRGSVPVVVESELVWSVCGGDVFGVIWRGGVSELRELRGRTVLSSCRGDGVHELRRGSVPAKPWPSIVRGPLQCGHVWLGDGRYQLFELLKVRCGHVLVAIGLGLLQRVRVRFLPTAHRPGVVPGMRGG